MPEWFYLHRCPDQPWGQQILARVQTLNLPVEELPRNRLAGLRD